MKKIAIGILVIVCAFVLAILIAPLIIDLNKYKGTIVSRARQQIHRDVDFQDIKLTILGGIGAEIKGLRVADNPEFSQEDFLSLDALQVHLEFLPLLKKQVSIKKVTLKGPVVRVLRGVHGEFNFDDLIEGNQDETVPSGQAPSSHDQKNAAKKDSVSPLLAMFVVKDLDIRGGKVLYTEQNRSPVIIDAIDLGMQDISLDEPISIRLEASLPDAQDQNFKLSGKFGPIRSSSALEMTPFDMKVTAHSLPLAKLSEYLTMPMEIKSGTIGLDITAAGSLKEKIRSEAKMDLNNLVVKQNSKGKTGNETGPITGSLETICSFDHARQKLEVESGLLTANENKISFKGMAENFLRVPAWNITVSSDGLDPAGIIKVLPMYAGLIPAEIDFSGPARFEIASRGNMKQFDIAADVDMEKMHLAYGELFDKQENIPFSLLCKASMKDGTINAESLQLILHQLSMNGSGQVDLSGKIPRINILIKSQSIALKGWGGIAPVVKPYDLDGAAALQAVAKGSLDDLAVNISAGSETLSFIVPDSREAEKGSTKSKSQLNGANIEIAARRQKDQLSGSADIKVKKGTLLDAAFDSMTGRLRLTPEMLMIESFDVNAFKGNIKTTGSYALGRGTWSASPVLKNVAAGKVLDTLPQYKGIFSGTLSGRFQVSGSAAKPVLDALKAKGSFALNKGQWNNLDLGAMLLDDFSKIEGMAELFGLEKETIQRHDTTSFDSLDGSIDLAGGIVNISTLTLKNIRTSRDTDSLASLSGTADLNTQALNLKGDVALSQKLSTRLIKRTPELGAFLNAKQRIVLPVRIKGSLNKPVLTLRTKEVNEALAKYYAKKKLEKGVDRLKERLGIPGGDDGTEEIIDNLLNGILKK